MDTPKAIVFAAAIIAVAIVLANLNKLETTGTGAGAFRVNTITGTVSVCSPSNCRVTSQK